MISETRFARDYASFWDQAMPMATKALLRLNVALTGYSEALESAVSPDRYALVNELGFRLFLATLGPGGADLGNVSEELLENLAAETAAFLAGAVEDQVEDELEEAQEIARGLAFFFREYEASEEPVGWPEFPGCGILAACRGDVLAGTTLYEVKARGQRSFRQIDLRQLLVYCALNSVQGRHPIDRLGLLNPRAGVVYTTPVERLVRDVTYPTSLSPVELFSEIVDFVSSDRVSG